eukprot:scaffold355243_cov18-Prasinocladus_malaysianus.AAC.1
MAGQLRPERREICGRVKCMDLDSRGQTWALTGESLSVDVDRDLVDLLWPGTKSYCMIPKVADLSVVWRDCPRRCGST